MFQVLYKAVLWHNHKTIRIKQFFLQNNILPLSDDSCKKGRTCCTFHRKKVISENLVATVGPSCYLSVRASEWNISIQEKGLNSIATFHCVFPVF